MEARARAGIDLYDRILRYAEIEQYGSRYRLLRLGSCLFDFDVVGDVFSGPESDRLGIVSDALKGVFKGSVAGSLHVAVHPPYGCSFFSPIASGASDSDRRIRLQQEALLMAGTDQVVHITADSIRSETLRNGDALDWVHVLAVSKTFQKRIQRVADALPQVRTRLMASVHAVATTVNRTSPSARRARGRGPYTLAVGWYSGHVEYTLCRDEQWYFSKSTDVASPADVAYFALDLLSRLHLRPEDVDRLLSYGNDVESAHFSDLETMLELDVEPLNPLSVLDLDERSLVDVAAVEAYVACIGAAL